MSVKYKEVVSELKSLPSGLPQGCYISVILFIILINGAFLRPPIPRVMKTTGSGWNVRDKFLALKFLDDCSAAAKFDLKSTIELETRDLPRPLTFNQRNGFRLKRDNNFLQKELNNFLEFTKKRNMILNDKKSEVMVFNFSQLFSFPPDLTLKSSEPL